MTINRLLVLVLFLSLLVTFASPIAERVEAETPDRRAPSLLLRISDLLSIVGDLKGVLLLQGSSTAPAVSKFYTPLSLGDNHSEVYQLQVFLNRDPDTRVALTGAGSPGLETSYFGSLTEVAVKKFQHKHLRSPLSFLGIFAPSGRWDEATIDKANSLIDAQNNRGSGRLTESKPADPPRRSGGGRGSGGGSQTPPNEAPVVDAGGDLVITLPNNSVTLSGSATDDGRPSSPGGLTYAWEQVAGPGSVTFADPASLSTTATFSAAGIYQLRLSAYDGALTGQDDVTVTVNPEPTPENSEPLVNAGVDQYIVWPTNSVTLSGSATDDGLPNPPGVLTYEWSVVDPTGPGLVSFADSDELNTGVVFSEPGVYTLRLTVSDSELSASDEVVITVGPEPDPQNQSPSIVAASATPSAITLPDNSVNLSVSATDDGLPVPPGALSYAWSRVSGPSSGYTINSPSSANTAVAFTQPGSYVFRVEVSDGELTDSETVGVTVNAQPEPTNQAPVVNAGSDLVITLPNPVTLSGSATDDGLPNPPGTISSNWTRQSGPGSVSFTDASNLSTTASFSVAGTYVLRLSVSDGDLVSTDDVTVTVSPEPSGGSGYQNVSFTADNVTDFLNPERGWMDRARVNRFGYDPRSGDSDHHGYSVVWSDPWGEGNNGFDHNTGLGSPFRLDNYRTENLPNSLLTALQDEFAAARDRGVKLKVRFSYNYDETGQDTTEAWMKTHIQQLSPVLNANADTIASMDLGFIGLWGELHGSTHLVSSSNDWWEDPWISARNSIMQSLLDATPDWLNIHNRYPLFVRDAFGDPGYNMNLNQRFTGTDQSRIGWYNDCFLSDRSNVGTFAFDVSESRGNLDRDTFSKIGRYAATTGETCNRGLNQYNTGAAALAEMEVMNGPDTLYRKYWVGHYDSWISSGHYDEISRRLGYRLRLTEATLPTEVESGSSVNVSFNMTNDGFGKVYNPRPIDLVLRPSSGPDVRVRLTADARRDLPLGGESKALNYTVNLPSLNDGDYDLYLALPDPSPRLEDDPRYAIRLANTGIWVSGDGMHNLGVVMSVGGGGSEEPPVGPLLGVAGASTSLVDFPKTGSVTVGDWYVDINSGIDSTSGNRGKSVGSPFRTIQYAISQASTGDTILVRAGTYEVSSAIVLNKELKLFGYGNERPTIDRGFGGTTSGNASYALRLQGGNTHFKGFTITGVPERSDALYSSRAINFESSDNKIEDVWVTGNRSGNINSTNYSNNIVQDVRLWNNVMVTDVGTNSPDGISGSHSTNGSVISGMHIVRSMVANAGDDGYDLFRAVNSSIIDSVSIGAGYKPDGSSTGGDGGGFKMGGGANSGGNTLKGSLAVGNRATGLNNNSTPGSSNLFENNTSYLNRQGVIGDTGTAPTLRNNIAYGNTNYNTSVSGGTQQNNSWQQGTPSPQFAALSDGDLSLGAGSPYIGAGVGGANMGASDIALEIYLEWHDHPNIYNPGVSGEPDPEPDPDPDPDPEPPAHSIGPQSVVSTPVGQGTHFVSPSGSGSSCSSSSPCSLQTAISQSGPGDVVFLRGGTYTISSQLNISTSGAPGNPVTFESYPGERAVIDGQYNGGTRVGLWQENNYIVLRNIDVTRMTESGGIYVQGSNNLFDGVHSYNNRTSGFSIFAPYPSGDDQRDNPYDRGSNNIIRNCVAYGNSDVDTPAQGDNADGISVSSGNGNKVLNCLVYGNSDDGIDAWRATNTEFAYNLIHSNGLGPSGNGNGIKAGGPHPNHSTLVHHNIVYSNRSNGIDYNSGSGAMFYNNVSWDNNYGYVMGASTIVRNNVALDNNVVRGGDGTGGISSRNTWNSGFSVTANDFVSLDPNSPDFFKLKSSSSLVNAGVDVGLPYLGSAPDIGAIESY